MRPASVEGCPDVVMPGSKEYHDPSYPAERLAVLGIKTTCKDRWRQVLQEARRVQHKHILTLQPGISASQLREMDLAKVTLVVPDSLHKLYPRSEYQILSVDRFVMDMRTRFGK
jgi:hypothetical protein